MNSLKTFLIAICDHMYSGRFGTFLDDLSKDRMERNRQEKTESIWTYLCAKHRIYRYKNLYLIILNYHYHLLQVDLFQLTMHPNQEMKLIVF